MTVRELRESYIRFFESKGHVRFPSGSLVPYDVTGRLDESLLFNGAGMIQFKPYFRGVAEPAHRRLVTCQKCVRTGDIDEVGDATHLTFFEMLGNFAFGDYFKAQAIAYSWEFLTSPEWLGLDPSRLSFTVFETDDEAYAEWERWLIPAGIDPKTRVFRLGEETNYWPAGAFSSGPPGPCGPNSEMFYWVAPEPPPTQDYSEDDWRRDESASKWVEIWNDVFITYEWQGRPRDPADPRKGYAKEGMPELPFRSIDTGMGLERTALVLSGAPSVFDNDAFAPILARIDDLAGFSAPPADEPRVRARRIVADHTRTAVFCISDGVLPSNTGRGYVLRRLIRRAVLKGSRALGFERPFLADLYDGVVEAMGDFYPELGERRELIQETLRTEEEQFRRTLATGSTLLAREIEVGRNANGVFDGVRAFVLYDTYGFPIEVTRELVAEVGLRVDEEAYEAASQEARIRSRGATERDSVYAGVGRGEELALAGAPPATDFVGYECGETKARIVRVRPGPPLRVALDSTPFYAESGGQVGDRGLLTLPTGEELAVADTTKSGGVFWHEVSTPVDDSSRLLGLEVEARVLGGRRDRVRRNHTATHLLHAALREVLGPHVTQAGSYVGPEGLRFDFTHGRALSPDELERVERIVNERALANTPVVTHVDLPLDEARARGAMALFGEKYADLVRMVEIGTYSRELCGGTHVRSTGEVGLFKILSEASTAGGIRRIEAVTGEAAYEWAVEQARQAREAAALLKASPNELAGAVRKLLESAREERRRRERAERDALAGRDLGAEEVRDVAGVRLWVRDFGEADPKIVADAVNAAGANHPDQVSLAAAKSDGRASFVCKCGPEAIARGAHAGNLLREIARIVGGGGGGKPDFATAGGKQPERIPEALAAAADALERMLRAT